MRTNLPITNTELHIEEGKSIVSKTDLKGKITYVNPYFLQVSGFAEEELLGASHNIVRHPDMPAEAFADLWLSLKAGLPWTGLVKNRCKNGDFYWVRANIVPVRENGRVVGYMSVRTRAARDEIRATEQIYRAVKAGKAHGLAIHRGSVVKTGLPARLGRMMHIDLDTRIHLTMGTAIATLCAIAAFAQWRVRDSAIVIASLCAAVIMGYCWHALHAALIKPLRQAIAATYAITGGDLSQEIETDRHDETGQLLRALRQMNINLTAIIGDVRANVESMGLATGEIAVGNDDLAQRTAQQAAGIERTQ